MKALVFGIDGGSYNVIDRFMDVGVMPNLKSLLSGGVRGDLYIDSNHRGWATLMTGKDPSYHGGFYWQRVKDTYGLNDAFSLDRYDDLAVWRIASERGCRVGMAGMPTTFPAPKVRGFVIANGGGGIGPKSIDEAVFPDDLLGRDDALRSLRLDVRYADYAGADPQSYFGDLIEIVRTRSAVCLRLFEQFGVDLGMLVFEGPDRMQHWFYDDVVKASSENQDDGAPVVNLIRQYFRELDIALGKVIERYGNECPVFVISDHGFVRHDFDLHINEVLVQAGIARRSRAFGRRMRETTVKSLVRRLTPNLRVMVRGWVRRHYKGGQAGLTEPLLDWNRTVAYGHSGCGVYINRAGMLPSGIVGEGDYAAVVKDVIQALEGYRHPVTGAHIFRDVRDAASVYHGPRAALAPDVVFTIPPGYEVTRTFAPEGAITERSTLRRAEGSMPKRRSGIHGSKALFAAYGPGIPSGVDLGLQDMERFYDTLAAAVGLESSGKAPLL